MYATPKDVHPMIDVTLKVYDGTRLQLLIDYTKSKNAYYVVKDGDEKAVTNGYTELSEMVQQTAANATYLGEEEKQIENKTGKLAESQDSM